MSTITTDATAWIKEIRVGSDISKEASTKKLESVKDPHDEGTVAVADSTPGTPGTVQGATDNKNTSAMDPTNPMLGTTDPQSITDNPGITLRDGNADEKKYTDVTSPIGTTLGKRASSGAAMMASFVNQSKPAAPAQNAGTAAPATATPSTEQAKEAQVYPTQVPMQMMHKLASLMMSNEEARKSVEDILTKNAGADAVAELIGGALAEKVAYDQSLEAYQTKRAAVHQPLLDKLATDGEKMAHVDGARFCAAIIPYLLDENKDGLRKMAAEMEQEAGEIGPEDILMTIDLLAQNGDIDPEVAQQLAASVTQGDLETVAMLTFAAVDDGAMTQEAAQELLMSFGLSPDEIAQLAEAIQAGAVTEGAAEGAVEGAAAVDPAVAAAEQAAMEEEAMKAASTGKSHVASAFEGII